MARPRRAPGTQLKLRPADPFELIRWLARSQSDPRKAVAELVQNSLDAGARRVRVERCRIRKALALVVRDDGEGVLPEMEREEGLRYIATHIGHSRKLGLDPAERHRRVVAGKYGVGLLGFWCIGRHLELRSRVAGSALHALRLEEDSPSAEILRLPLRTDSPATFTEAVVMGVHPTAQRALGGRRLSEYLAAELRGQLLARPVELVVHDRVARGLAQKTFQVVPRRYVGERLELPAELEVPGHQSLRVELYLARGAERSAIQVACAGTLVAEDVAELAALGIAEEPWVGRELTGLLDFPDLNVPPGTRRGVMPDAAAEAFVEALGRLGPLVLARLEELERQRREETDRNVLRELRRALRGFRQRLPQYELPAVEAPGVGEPGGGAGVELPDASAPVASDDLDEGEAELPLFPPGPLASVRIVPEAIAIAPGAERRVRAVAVDAEDRPLKDAEYRWTCDDPSGVGLAVRGEGPRPAVCVRADAALGLVAMLRVEVRQDGRRAEAAAPVRVAAPEEGQAALGIPEPLLVSDPAGTWRSRMSAGRWEVNDAHEDYVALRGEPRARLRYLLALLVKEIILRSAGRPDAADLLESVVEILAHAERNLRGG
jgi:hypothetical protein